MYNKAYRMKYTKQAEEIVKRMTLREKVGLMSCEMTIAEFDAGVMSQDENDHYNMTPIKGGGNENHHVPPVLFCDGPRGVVCGIGKTTCFPVSMCRGATFDEELEYQIGEAIGEETLAVGGNNFSGVCVNLPYNPGWGRSQETYGEESFHLGRMGSALTRGVQSKGVVVCVKHFAFNQMEISRFKVDVNCDKRTEQEVFLPHFKDCIDAGAGAVMSAYNRYQAEFCGDSNYLLNKILKQDWAFDGFVMSDFIFGVHNTAKAAIAGQDLEMPVSIWYGDKLVKAVENGIVPEETIDEAAIRLVRTMLSAKDLQEKNNGIIELPSKAHALLAKKCAQEGITLIQNKGMLPLKKTGKILVLGKLAGAENIGDHGSSQVYPPYVVTPLAGIKTVGEGAEIRYDCGEDPALVTKLAKDADAVIVVVGFNHSDEGEYTCEGDAAVYTKGKGGDRQTLALHADEVELIHRAAAANANTAVVLIGGNTITMTDWYDEVDSILMAYYPGMEGGTAIAEILFGDVNPSGKLPFVIPQEETDLPQVRWDTESQWYEYYHGYAKLDKEGKKPLFPYGFGLSYTTFSFSDIAVKAADDAIQVQCTVTNTGKRTGTEVAQLYIGFEHSKIDRPLRLLRGFQRVELEPGESREISLECPIEKLKWYNPAKECFELEHTEYRIYVGNSEAEKSLISDSICL